MEKLNTVRITINWASVLSFVVFFTYGIYGFFTVPSFSKVTHSVVSAILFLLLICMLTLRGNQSFTSIVVLAKKDILIFLSYLVFLLFFSWKDLLTSIDGDQLYHAQQAMAPAFFVAQFLSNHFYSIVQHISYSYLLWGINIGLLCAVLPLYFIAKRISNIYVYGGIGLMFLVSRFLVLYAGGNGSAFPAFRLFPLWVSGTIFSSSSFGFRMAAFIGLTALMFTVQYYAAKKLPFTYAYILGIFAGTIPVLLHVGTLVEMSLWACFCLIFTLFIIEEWADGKKVEYVKVISVIVIFSCMRVSGFVTLVPVVGMMFFDYIQNKITRREVFHALIPIAVLVPVILAGAYIGTPSSYHGLLSLNPYIEANASLFHRLIVAITSGTFFTNVYDSIRFPLVIFLILLPFLIIRNSKKLSLVVPLFVMYFILFYSIEPGLWGHGRYQAEYIVPFIVYSMYLFSRLLGQKYKIVLLVLGVSIMSNIYLYTHMSEMNTASFGQDVYSTAMKNRSGYFVLSELPYNFKDALQSAKQDGFAGKLYYSPGNGYGYFAEILSGYTVGEMKQEKLLVGNVGVGIGTTTAEIINVNKDISLVLINGSKNNRETLNEQLVYNLQKKGWLPWKEFANKEHGTVIYGFKRVQ